MHREDPKLPRREINVAVAQSDVKFITTGSTVIPKLRCGSGGTSRPTSSAADSTTVTFSDLALGWARSGSQGPFRPIPRSPSLTPAKN
jgi:hypothetical protein